MYPAVRSGWKPLSLICLAALAACGGSGGGSSSKYSAEIRRTEMGIPHIKAKDWTGLGYGAGYAQAQDNLCTMADSFLTYRGERSRYLGGDAQAVYDSTIDRPRNLDSDFFFRHVVSDDAVAAMLGRDHSPVGKVRREVQRVLDGRRGPGDGVQTERG